MEMEETLELYLFYEIKLEEQLVKPITFAFTKDGKIIKHKKADFPDLEDIQIIKDDLKIAYDKDNTNVIFGKLLKKDIPISTDKDEIKNIIEILVPIISQELQTKYSINKTYQTKFTNIDKIVLEEDKKDFDTELVEAEQLLKIVIEESYESSVDLILKSNQEIKPSEIINSLKKKIIGQDEAIDVIVTNVLLNQKLIDMQNPDILRTSKTNILISGPTGCGKTAIVSLLAKKLNIPLELVSTTNYSTVGYKGDNLNSILVNLLRKTDGNLEKAKRGIICFDEIDKLGDSSLEIRKGLAQELLTWLSGTKIPVVYNHKEYIFDTSNLTFIGLGAFTNMRESKNTNQIGFSTTPELKEIFDTEDYISFGMSRELMGRMNVITNLKPLDIPDLENILINSKISPLRNLIEVIESFGVNVTFEDDLPHEIAIRASKLNIGARALSREVNKIRNKILFHIMEGNIENITLTSEMLEDDYIYSKENKKTLKMSE